MKYLALFILLVAVLACSHQSDVLETELPADMVDVAFTQAAPAYEVIPEKELKEVYGLEISSDKAADCRWKDDPSGGTYGTVKCGSGGKCTAIRSSGGRKIGLGCLDESGEPLPGTVTGAWRNSGN